jgi:Tetratricopeptide repeat
VPSPGPRGRRVGGPARRLVESPEVHDLGQLEAARSYLERALAVRKKVPGPDHPDTAASLTSASGVSSGPSGATRDAVRDDRVVDLLRP